MVLFIGTGVYTSKLYNDKKETEATLIKEKEQVMADLETMSKQYDVVIGENEAANQDLVEAKRWYKIAAREGLTIAQAALGDIYANNIHNKEDYF